MQNSRILELMAREDERRNGREKRVARVVVEMSRELHDEVMKHLNNPTPDRFSAWVRLMIEQELFHARAMTDL